MPDFCTCGAQLPPDALFCHKCGKPQRDISAVEPEPPPPPQPPTVPIPPPQIMRVSFRNPTAVRIALFVAVAAMLFNWLPLVNWVAAGFFAVFFYRRKTRNLVNVGAGVYMGWITGVIMSTMQAIFFAGLLFTGKLAGQFQDQLKNLPYQDPAFRDAAQQMAQFLESGPGVVVLLVMFFVFITCFSMAGGALGAKLVGRPNGSSRAV